MRGEIKAGFQENQSRQSPDGFPCCPNGKRANEDKEMHDKNTGVRGSHQLFDGLRFVFPLADEINSEAHNMGDQ